MDDDGNDPVTRHEDESCASSQKDDGNQQEEAGTHPASGTESLEEPGATRQSCATTSAPSSSKDVVDLQKQLESLESTLRTIPRLTFLVEDFGARIANMEAAQDKTERKPPTKTDSTRVGEVSRQDVDTLTENRSTAARQSQIRPSQAQVMDDHQRFVDEGDETPDEIPSEAPRIAPKNPCPDSYYTSQRSRRLERYRKQSRTSETYESSSEDDYNDQEYVTGVEEESTLRSRIVPFHSRPVGPPHIGLRSIKPANRVFDKLMSYRSYRLKKTSDTRSACDTTEVRVHLKNMDLTMSKHKFDGNDPIRVFDFLTRFVNESDMLNMSEAQSFIALPMFLEEPAETHFRTTLSGMSRRGGVTCWPEAVQYMLRTYATPTAMREALETLRDVRQENTETEEDYRKRLNVAIHRCGNVHSEDEKMTLYVDGLAPTIRTVVARHRESVNRREMTFEGLAHFARSEDEVVRARAQLSSSTQIPTPRPRTSVIPAAQVARTPVNLLEQVDGTPGSPQHEELLVTTQESQDFRQEAVEEGDLFYVDQSGERRRRPPRVAFDTSRTARAGWAAPETPICFSCYEKGHLKPQCPLKLANIEMAVVNFDKLTTEERERVPRTSYEEAKSFLELRANVVARAAAGTQTDAQSKN